MNFLRVIMAGVVALVYAGCVSTGSARNGRSHRQALSLIAQVQEADYLGDLAELRRLHSRMEPLLSDSALARDIRYWRGFALWRRATNAANEGVLADSIIADLEASAVEFQEALILDTGYVEARIGKAAVLMNAAHFRRHDWDRATVFMTEALRLVADARKADPDNPRLVFVAAARTYWALREYGGDRLRAIAEVERALAANRQAAPGRSPLEPVWGEAELHMQLAFFHLNVDPPHHQAARHHARRALALSPRWHYVRDILLPQIESSAKAAGS